MKSAFPTETSLSVGDVVFEMIAIPPGQLLMGSDRGLPLEQPVHSVRVESAFLLGSCPVTQVQWVAVMRFNPAEFQTNMAHPVENVSWDDCQAFCRRLSELCGRAVRLPSEAEWEYACRAGTTCEFYHGDE